MDRMRKDAALY